MKNTTRLLELNAKHLANAITDAERQEYYEYIIQDEYRILLANIIKQQLDTGASDGPALNSIRSENIISKILSLEKETEKLIPDARRQIAGWTSLAAAVLLLIVTGAGILFVSRTRHSPVPEYASRMLTGSINQKKNLTDSTQKILLQDGSEVSLDPGAALTFPEHFKSNKREVYLEGNAFFSVSRNSRQPFYVYHKNIVTHVLGTSFYIATLPNSNNVEVSVKTGKVEVYENHEATAPGSKTNGVILTPNQKVVYNPKLKNFEATALVNMPLPVNTLPEEHVANIKSKYNASFIYEEKPLYSIIKDIEKTYAIAVELENENIGSCLFTGDISMADLFKKLELLCLSLNASYEVRGTQILIKGKGCSGQAE